MRVIREIPFGPKHTLYGEVVKGRKANWPSGNFASILREIFNIPVPLAVSVAPKINQNLETPLQKGGFRPREA